MKVVRKVLLAVLILGLLGCIVPTRPVCRHEAMASAILYAEQGKEVRIAAYSLKSGERHAEAQVKEHDGWKFITQTCDKNTVSEFPDFNMVVVQYYELHAYLLHLGIVPSYDKSQETQDRIADAKQTQYMSRLYQKKIR